MQEKEQLASIRPDLDGEQVMEHLGIKPGRTVGKALEFLLQVRLDEGPMSDDQAYARLDVWASEQGKQP